ncbi:MAG TPA: PDZ domain-containing protein [Puia sp.]|nr:PDZ domain-containing protein [Puia sp.]
MNKHLNGAGQLLRLSGLAALVLLLQSSGFAQSSPDKVDKDTSVNNLRGYDEIIIKRKSDKDAKVTIEIRNGEVLIDGKPASDFKDDDISVRKRKIRVMDGRTFSFTGPDGDLVAPRMPGEPGEPGEDGAPRIYKMPSPFRDGDGGWSYEGKKGRAANQAFLGVSSEKIPDGDGVLIKDISDSSAAEKAGLKKGDIIVKVDEISVDNPEELSEAIHKYKPEDKVTITFYRDKKKQQVMAVLGKARKTLKTFQYNMPDMQGFEFKKMMPPMDNFPGFEGFKGRGRLGIHAQDTEEGKGVKVLEVDDESAAAKGGIKEGDVITRFDGKEVNSASALAEAAQASKAKPSVHINLLRGGKPMDLEIKTPRKLRTADL